MENSASKKMQLPSQWARPFVTSSYYYYSSSSSSSSDSYSPGGVAIFTLGVFGEKPTVTVSMLASTREGAVPVEGSHETNPSKPDRFASMRDLARHMEKERLVKNAKQSAEKREQLWTNS